MNKQNPLSANLNVSLGDNEFGGEVSRAAMTPSCNGCSPQPPRGAGLSIRGVRGGWRGPALLHGFDSHPRTGPFPPGTSSVGGDGARTEPDGEKK